MLIISFVEVAKLVVMLESSMTTTQGTLWNIKAMPNFRETSVSFL